MTNRLKSLIFLLLSLPFCVFQSYSQDILWEKSYGGKQADYLMDAVATADYGFILAGSSLSRKSGNKSQDNVGNLDYWIWKMNEEGEMDWQKNLGGTGADFLQSIFLTRDGGFILAGTSNSEKGFDKKEDCRGQDDFWIIKLNAGGGEEWQKTIGGSGQEKLQSIYQTRDGGFILGGSSSSNKSESSLIDSKGQTSRGEKTENSFGNLDYWVVKLDAKGKISWQKTIGGIYYDELRSIEQTRDGGYILGGYSNSPASGNKTEDNIGIGDYWVVKLDIKGEIEWQKTIGGDKDDQFYVVHQTYDGGYLLGGNSNSGANNFKSKGNGKGTDFWIVKLEEDGMIQWQETYDFGSIDILTSMVENKDHTILVGGLAKSETEQTAKKDDKGINDYIAMKISEKGENLWDTSVGSDGDDVLKKLIETRDGGYLLAGTSNPIPFKNNANTKGKSKSSKSGISLGNNQQQNEQLAKAISAVNNQIKETTQDINDAYAKQATKLTNDINNTLNSDKDSPLKSGINVPNNPLKSPLSFGNGETGASPLDGLLGGANQKPKIPASRNKANNLGNNDFWVVKLRDKKKPVKVKATIEAMPNPATTFTNIIVGYDFEDGTATLVDMGGRVLQQFKITSRTVPVDLSSYPDGIYVVNIKTNVQNDGVKVVKGMIKN